MPLRRNAVMLGKCIKEGSKLPRLLRLLVPKYIGSFLKRVKHGSWLPYKSSWKNPTCRVLCAMGVP